MLTKKAILIGALGISLAQVSPVPLSEVQDAVPAFTVPGTVTLPATRLALDVVYPQGKKGQSELTVIYDPETGYYIWSLTRSDSRRPEQSGRRINTLRQQQVAALVRDGAGLIQFDFGMGLFARASRSRANSLGAAVIASINEVRREVAGFGDIILSRYYKMIPAFGLLIGFEAPIPPGYKFIGREFFCAPDQAICQFEKGKIVSITKQGNNYRLLLRNRFDVEVIVDQNLDLVSAQQLTQPAQ